MQGSGSTTIYANSYVYDYQGSGTTWSGLPGVDVSAPMAALVTGQAQMLGVYLNPATNALAVVTGTIGVFTNALDPPRPGFPNSVLPVSWLRIYGSQAGLAEADIRDARRPFAVGMDDYILANGTRPFTGNQSLGTNNLTNVGALGIGSTPSYPLDIRSGAISSQMHFAASDVDSGGYIVSTAPSNFFFSGGVQFNGTNWIARHTEAGIIGVGPANAGEITFYTNDSLTVGNTVAVSERMRIDNAGNVGIGVTPAAQLHVKTGAADALPVVTLEQTDIDEDYLKFIGTSDTNVDRALVDAADFTTPGTIKGWLKINVQDDQATNPIVDGDYYIPFYSAPTA